MDVFFETEKKSYLLNELTHKFTENGYRFFLPFLTSKKIIVIVYARVSKLYHFKLTLTMTSLCKKPIERTNCGYEPIFSAFTQ